MKLEEAIKIKLQWRKDNYPPALADEMNADMLSIEALDFLRQLQLHHIYITFTDTPGETKD